MKLLSLNVVLYSNDFVISNVTVETKKEDKPPEFALFRSKEDRKSR